MTPKSQCSDAIGNVPPLVVAEGDVGYGNVAVLRDASLRVRSGEIVGLVGPNGSGKSTLLKAIIGEARILKGTFSVSGKLLARGRSTDFNCRNNRIAYLPQGRRGVENLTVEENICLAAWDRGSARSRAEAAQAVLSSEAFQALRGHETRQVGLLSGGQRLLLSLAMLAVRKCGLFLLDEPSAGADQTSMLAAEMVIRDLAASGAGVLIVEQRLGFLDRVAHSTITTCAPDTSDSDVGSPDTTKTYTIGLVSDREVERSQE